MFEIREYKMNNKNLLLTIAVLSAITILSHLVSNSLNGINILLHFISLFFGCWYAINTKNLTAWIMVCMFMGVALGLDLPLISQSLEEMGLPFHFPSDAKPLRIFSDIFLRLIKTIIAPLLLATLVVGIAGHSNIKQVGRMGLKAIGYFEVVTTLALIVGLLAINISGAGWGTNLNAAEAQVEKAEKLLAQKQSHDVILDIFPENIAKSVADNQILQIDL
jgi:proton glutamate symport protein